MRNGNLDIVSTHDAESPLTTGAHPLMVCDVWEHAYYLDYQNRRADFVRDVLNKLVNWQFIAAQLKEADRSMRAPSRSAYAS
jgi:superoxide dismutase, Fe-Mn family